MAVSAACQVFADACTVFSELAAVVAYAAATGQISGSLAAGTKESPALGIRLSAGLNSAPISQEAPHPNAPLEFWWFRVHWQVMTENLTFCASRAGLLITVAKGLSGRLVITLPVRPADEIRGPLSSMTTASTGNTARVRCPHRGQGPVT